MICNLGSGAATRSVYRVVSFARDKASTGNVEKTLLHPTDRQQVKESKASSEPKAKGRKARKGKGKKAGEER